MPESSVDKNRDELLSIVERRLKTSGLVYLIVTWASVIVAIFGLFSILVDNPVLSYVGGIVFLGMGVFMGLFGLFLYVNQGRARSHPLYLALRDHPELIVWVFIRRVTQNVAGVSAPAWSMVCVGLDDGSMAQLQVGQSEEEPMIRVATSLAPQATVGYSDELAHRFQQNPRSLRIDR